ncbi:hypothetical protein BKA70DRAFT_1554582 [Coprinopsis sp. MPI-PUGE-AT-0042]|nr:hypothetical protein BKA70DRAFT_1554582 [Coprinopsis sp. MPI-PUGE-AT-0042]
MSSTTLRRLTHHLPKPNRTHTSLLHTSSTRLNRVAPPHPISHLRPIIYDDATPSTSSSSSSPVPRLLPHPYSLSEFQDASKRGPVDLELQYKLQRQQLDAFHQDFWLDNNIRYFAAKETVLSNLPAPPPSEEPASPASTHAAALARENALSEFNTHWYNQEKDRVDAYTSEWRSRNWALIKLAAKVQWQKWGLKVSSVMSSSPAS